MSWEAQRARRRGVGVSMFHFVVLRGNARESRMKTVAMCLSMALVAGMASAQFANFDADTEGFKGLSFTSGGITFFDANNVSGFYPDGEAFGPTDNGNDLIVENALFAANDFPAFLSAKNALTFGTAFIPGDNVSLGALATVSMTTGKVENSVELDMVYYENGPWGGIEVVMEALMDGSVVGSTSFFVSNNDPTGRDNPAGIHLSLDGVNFDTVRVFARLQGEYTTIRALFDNVSIVPSPGAAVLLGIGAIAARRRR